MAQEENNTTSPVNMDAISSIIGNDSLSLSDAINMESLEEGLKENEQMIREKENENKQSIKDILTDLQSVTADKAVLTDSFNALENISFKDLIGKPIQAAIEAQADAAKSTLDFVKGLCVKGSDGSEQVAVVSFEFFKNGKKARINLPLLSLVNIPSLEITSMTYHFTAKIDSHSSLIVTHNSGATTNSKSASSGTSQTTEMRADSNRPAEETQTQQNESQPSQQRGRQSTQQTENQQAQQTGNQQTQQSRPAATAAAAASDPKSNVAKETTFSASYTQPSTTATKDSKYAVQTTMDISITVAPNEIPGGIKTMLSILDGAIEVINPNGELTVSHQQLEIQNGYAIATASYRDPDGLCVPGDIKCKSTDKGSAPQVMLNGDTAKIIFTKPGMYTITAGKVSEPIFVTGTVATGNNDSEAEATE